MTDITNWYDKIGVNNKKKKQPKHWKDHHILHNSMVLCIGGTGTGKTNALMDCLSRSSGEFNKIVICSFSTLEVVYDCRPTALKYFFACGFKISTP